MWGWAANTAVHADTLAALYAVWRQSDCNRQLAPLERAACRWPPDPARPWPAAAAGGAVPRAAACSLQSFCNLQSLSLQYSAALQPANIFSRCAGQHFSVSPADIFIGCRPAALPAGSISAMLSRFTVCSLQLASLQPARCSLQPLACRLAAICGAFSCNPIAAGKSTGQD